MEPIIRINGERLSEEAASTLRKALVIFKAQYRLTPEQAVEVEEILNLMSKLM